MWRPPDSSPETFACARPGPHPRPVCDDLRWAAGTEGSASAAFAAQLEITVKQRSAWNGVETSGVRVLGEGGAGGSCGARGSVGGDGCSVHGWGDGGHGAGIRAVGPACAGEGAGDGDRPALAVMTSSPSCDPWSSCCHSTCPLDGGREQLSVSVSPPSALGERGGRGTNCCGRGPACPSCWSP